MGATALASIYSLGLASKNSDGFESILRGRIVHAHANVDTNFMKFFRQFYRPL